MAEGTYKHNNYTQYKATRNTRLTCRVSRFQKLTNWRPLRRGRGQRPSCGSHFREYEFKQGLYGYSLHTYAVTVRLLRPHLEAFPGYMQSMPELCATIRGTFAPADLVHRPTLCAVSISSSGAIRLVPCHIRWKIWKC